MSASGSMGSNPADKEQTLFCGAIAASALVLVLPGYLIIHLTVVVVAVSRFSLLNPVGISRAVAAGGSPCSARSVVSVGQAAFGVGAALGASRR